MFTLRLIELPRHGWCWCWKVPEAVLRVSNWSEAKGAFVPLCTTDLLSKAVVVATLGVAGKLWNMGVPRGHFDLMVIDEAGQALEPEASLAPALYDRPPLRTQPSVLYMPRAESHNSASQKCWRSLQQTEFYSQFINISQLQQNRLSTSQDERALGVVT